MDTLMRAKKLEDLGFERPKAEGLVLMVKESIDEEVAKKSDLIAVKSELKSDIAALRSELKTDIAELRSEITLVKSELKADIAALHVKIEHIDNNLRSEIKRVEQTLGLKITSESKSLFIKMVILMITMTGIILRQMS